MEDSLHEFPFVEVVDRLPVPFVKSSIEPRGGHKFKLVKVKTVLCGRRSSFSRPRVQVVELRVVPKFKRVC